MTTKTHKTNWILAAAVAAVPLLAGALPAMAQYQTGNDGRARDANNRVGSNGYNGGGAPRTGQNVTGNQIITGNVTGGREFRGAVPYRDAREFRGPTAGVASDRFVRDSSGAPSRAEPNAPSAASPQAFYGQSRAVAPPPGFVQLGATGGFVEAPAAGAGGNYNVSRLNSGFSSPHDLGFTAYSTGQSVSAAASLGTRVLPGAIDPQTQQQSLILVSPFGGIRQLTQGEATDYFVARNPGDRVNTADRFGSDTRTAAQIRQELDAGTGAQPNAQQTPTGQQSPNGQQTPNPQQLGNPALPSAQLSPTQSQPQELPAATPLPAADPLSAGAAAAAGEVPTAGGPRRLAVPAQQSNQYNDLQQRLRRYEAIQADPLNRLNPPPHGGAVRPTLPPSGQPLTPGAGTPGSRVAPGTTRPATPGSTTRPSTPGVGAGAGAAAPAARPAAPGPRPEPLVIKSLATGVRSPTLAKVLVTAEDLMKKGRFADALDQYDKAEQAVPNNPLVFLGKANAELGASSYRTAETHIRQAFAGDRALMMGRYDLNSFIGADRLQILTKDLKELAQANPDDPMAPFLLGYIYYNTGDGAQAAVHLVDAEKRAGGRDAVITLMRQHWAIPAPGAATDAPAETPKAQPLNK